MLASRDRRVVETLIEAPLPKSIEDLNYYKYQPSPDLYARYIYVKFRAPKEDYVDLMNEMGVPLHDKSDPSLKIFLPGSWKILPPLHLEWWNPEISIPEDTAMLVSSSGNWTVAKHENGYVYLVMYKCNGSTTKP